MESTAAISTLVSAAGKLTRPEQLQLIQQLLLLLEKPAATPAPHLTELAGLGSELWQNTAAINDYLDEERQW